MAPDLAPSGNALTFCAGCRELVRLEADGCPCCAMLLDLRRREEARARDLIRAEGLTVPAWLADPELPEVPRE